MCIEEYAKSMTNICPILPRNLAHKILRFFLEIFDCLCCVKEGNMGW